MIHSVLRLLALAALSLGALSACTTGPRPGAGAPAQGPRLAAEEPVLAALMVPRSAADRGVARNADALIAAARLAEAEVAETRLVLAVYDTAGRPEVARAVAQQAIDDGADVILGPLFGLNTEEIAPIAAAARVPVFSFSNRTDVAGGPVWITGNTPESDVRRVAAFADRRGQGAIGVFHSDTEEGRAALRGVAQVRAQGLAQVPVAVPYERSVVGIQAAAGPFVRALAETRAGAVLLPAGGDELKAVVATLGENGLDPRRTRLLGTQRWKAEASLETPALRGGWFAAADPGRERAFAARFERQYGNRPTALAYLGYDAVRIAGELVREARARGGANAFAAADIVRPTGFPGAVGPVRFGVDQAAERASAVLEVRGDGFRVVDPAPASFAAGS